MYVPLAKAKVPAPMSVGVAPTAVPATPLIAQPPAPVRDKYPTTGSTVLFTEPVIVISELVEVSTALVANQTSPL